MDNLYNFAEENLQNEAKKQEQEKFEQRVAEHQKKKPKKDVPPRKAAYKPPENLAANPQPQQEETKIAQKRKQPAPDDQETKKTKCDESTGNEVPLPKRQNAVILRRTEKIDPDDKSLVSIYICNHH